MVERLGFIDDVFARAKAIMVLKNHDYANDTDPFSNLRECEKQGVPAWKGALIRCSDKYSRENEFSRKGMLKVKDESFIDTCLDHINYLAIVITLFEEDRHRGNAERVDRESDNSGDKLGGGDGGDGTGPQGSVLIDLPNSQALEGYLRQESLQKKA